MTATAQLPFRQDHPLRSSEQLRALQSDGPIHKVLTPVGDMAQQGPPADLHASLAQPFPVLVICDLLGVPYSERDRFRVWVEDAAFSADDTASLNGLAALLEYGLELVAVKRSEPVTTSSPGCARSRTSATSRSPRWACSCCSPGTRRR